LSRSQIVLPVTIYERRMYLWREKLGQIFQLKPIFYLSQHVPTITDFIEVLSLNQLRSLKINLVAWTFYEHY
jgi:hypothetical protein